MDPTLIITGASRGLGAATASIGARLGANVVLNARSSASLNKLADQIHQQGGSVLAIPGDIRREEICQELIQKAVQHFGSVDGLVNNGGVITPIDPIAGVSIKEWEHNFAVNLFAPVMLIQQVLPYLRLNHGRVVNITSGATVNIIPGWGAYSTAKVAINYLTRILAVEEPQITAIALRPGTVDTPMQEFIRAKGQSHMGERNYNYLTNLHEQGRLLPPEKPALSIAHLALFAPHEWSGEMIQWDDPRVLNLIREEDKHGGESTE